MREVELDGWKVTTCVFGVMILCLVVVMASPMYRRWSAEARTIEAESEAQAIRVQSDALKSSPDAYLDYLRIKGNCK